MSARRTERSRDKSDQRILPLTPSPAATAAAVVPKSTSPGFCLCSRGRHRQGVTSTMYSSMTILAALERLARGVQSLNNVTEICAVAPYPRTRSRGRSNQRQSRVQLKRFSKDLLHGLLCRPLWQINSSVGWGTGLSDCGSFVARYFAG